MILPSDFLPRTTQLLLPRLTAPDEREAWLAQAFFLNDPRLYHDLRQLDGVPIVYVTRCITALLTAKCIPGRDVHSLALLLNAVRIGSAPAEQREIDTLVEILDPMCGPGAPEINTPQEDKPIKKPALPLQSIDTPEDKRTPTVFISYSHQDDDFAHRLIHDLQERGHAVWIDTMSIKGGDAWVRSIADGIRNSYAFVTIISPPANASRWVLREYLLAENLRKPIYPVLGATAEIPFQMIDRQVIMMHEDYSIGLTQLFDTLPSPTIPVPAIENVITPPAALPAPQPPPSPVTRSEVEKKSDTPRRPSRPSRSSTILDGLRDLFQGKEAEEMDDALQEIATSAPSFETPPQMAPQMARNTPDRANELQYLQRKWAEVFSMAQDTGGVTGKADVRWSALPASGVIAADGGELLPVTQLAALLGTHARIIAHADTPHAADEAFWVSHDALTQAAFADIMRPLPVVLDLAAWDGISPLSDFAQQQLDELHAYWPGLAAQGRLTLVVRHLTDSSTAPLQALLDSLPAVGALVIA